jgi:hypothetical protein
MYLNNGHQGLLFIPQVIYEHRETWWNDIDMGKLIRSTELSLAILTAVIKWQTRRNMTKMMMRLAFVPVQKRVRVPNESGHEVRQDPDILASSPDRYKGR